MPATCSCTADRKIVPSVRKKNGRKWVFDRFRPGTSRCPCRPLASPLVVTVTVVRVVGHVSLHVLQRAHLVDTRRPVRPARSFVLRPPRFASPFNTFVCDLFRHHDLPPSTIKRSTATGDG